MSMRRAIVAACTLVATGAFAGNLKVQFKGRVNSVDGERSPFSCLVKITHDVFFGDATTQVLAGECRRADGTPMMSPTIYACYDIMQGPARRATLCEGPVLEADLAGSPNWNKLFPGLSAAEAKALVKAGFTIENVRLSATRLTAGGPGSTASATPPPPPPEASPPAETPPPAAPTAPDEDGARVSAECRSPSVEVNGTVASCLLPNVFSTNQAVNRADGTQQGRTALSHEVQWRLPGALTWNVLQDAGGNVLARPTLGPVDPCRTYEVRARSRCDDGSVSGWTSRRMSTTCPGVNTLRAASAGPGEATLSWRTPAGGWANCLEVAGATTEVQVSEQSAAWRDIVPVGGKLLGLTPGARCAVRVRRTFPGGTSSDWEKTTFTAGR